MASILSVYSRVFRRVNPLLSAGAFTLTPLCVSCLFIVTMTCPCCSLKAPVWLEEYFEKSRAGETKLMNALEVLGKTIESQQVFIMKQKSMIARLDEQINSQQHTIAILLTRTTALEQANSAHVDYHDPPTTPGPMMTDIDQNEMLLSGIPVTLKLSSEEIASQVAEALELPIMRSHIISTREWKPPVKKSLLADRTAPKRVPGRAIVLKLSSSTTRDKLAASSYKLAHMKAGTIFNGDSDARLSLSPLWPKRTYELYKMALKLSRSLKFAKPLVHNLQVYLREKPRSTPIVVKSEEDLNLFKKRRE